MKFGNASWGFRETPLEEQLATTQSMGLKVLELGIANAPGDIPLTVSDEELAEVKKLYDKYDIELCCAATGNDFSNGDKNDVEKIKRVIDICSILGVRYIRIFAGFSPVAEVVGDRWDNMIECITEVAEYAKDKGVYPVIETHGGVIAYDDGVEHFLSTSADEKTMYKMMNELPDNVKVNFDPANLWAVGNKHPENVFNNLKDRVAVVHLKDFVPLPSGHIKPAACGESDMDWSAILESLADFDGPALFEYENVEDVEDGLKKCYDYISRLCKKQKIVNQ